MKQVLNRKKLTLGRVTNIALGAIAGSAAILASCSYWYNSYERKPSPSVHVTSTPRSMRATLISAGLAPDVLCAAGLTTQQVTTVVGAGREFLTDHLGDVETANASFAEASTDVNRLERLAQQGKATEQDRTDLGTARTSLASAVTARESALAAVFNAATESLTANQKALIQQFQANRGQSVPLKYRGTSRTDAEWVRLRDAVSNQAIATRRGEDLDGTSAQILSDANTAETVRAAAAVAGLTDVRAAWQSAAEPPP
ncbi:hypothetical protein PHYC_02003 [Phycisphaerales bacterium]|nr:hypothetical protein PHYC_02003 [Phycisphaerales bacterium]